MTLTWVLSCPGALCCSPAQGWTRTPGFHAEVEGGVFCLSPPTVGPKLNVKFRDVKKTHFCLISLSCPEEFLPRQGETLDSCLLQTRITLFVTRMACLGAHWKAPRLPQETSTANCTAMVQPSRERPASRSPWMVRMVLLNGGGEEDLSTQPHPQEPGAGPGREVSLWVRSESPHAQLCTPTP